MVKLNIDFMVEETAVVDLLNNWWNTRLMPSKTPLQRATKNTVVRIHSLYPLDLREEQFNKLESYLQNTKCYTINRDDEIEYLQ